MSNSGELSTYLSQRYSYNVHRSCVDWMNLMHCEFPLIWFSLYLVCILEIVCVAFVIAKGEFLEPKCFPFDFNPFTFLAFSIQFTSFYFSKSQNQTKLHFHLELIHQGLNTFP